MSALAATQREIARLVRAPEGVRSVLAEEGARTRKSLAGLVRDEPPLGAAERLEIYANAYFYRIRDVLAEEYESLLAAIGDHGFHDLATLYLWTHPSVEPSLANVGTRLPGFLASHPAAAPFRARWPFAADLAVLENALSEAFRAEDVPPLTREDLASVPPDQWAKLVFSLHPSARVLRLAWSVLAFHEARLGDGPAPPPPDAPESALVLIWRLDERPRTRSIDAREAALLDALAAGESFEALCARAGADVGAERAAAWVAERLGAWIAAGLLAARA